MCGPERPPTIWKTSSNLVLPAPNAAIEDQQHSMDVNDDLQVEEDLSGLEESAAGASSDAGKDTAAKRSRKRRREPTVKIEEKKKTGPKGKGARDRQGGFGRCLCTMRTIAWCGAPLHLWLLLLEKRRST